MSCLREVGMLGLNLYSGMGLETAVLMSISV